MAHIVNRKGVDLPIKGAPEGLVRTLAADGQTADKAEPRQIALRYDPFTDLHLRLLVRPGERVEIGQPLAEDKGCPGRFFISPAGGTLKEEVRGAKRVLLGQLVELQEGQETHYKHNSFSLNNSTREELLAFLLKAGGFTHIRQRPFDTLADPTKKPRSIFVKAVESAPFTPSAEMQIEGHEEAFSIGLDALKKLTEGVVHLVYHAKSQCKSFTGATGVEKHTVEGPHPSANHSLHIHLIDPIEKAEDVIWTVSAVDVVIIGYLISKGLYHIERIVGLGGAGLKEGKPGFYRARMGCSLKLLVGDKLIQEPLRLISGDPLTGRTTSQEGFLGFYDTVVSAIPAPSSRELLHFFRLGRTKYSLSRTYASGHLDNSKRQYLFTTNQHGEHRAFIDATMYDKVMPLQIPVMQLVKAIMAEDFDRAVELGLLEVTGEDFALTAFVDPSKNEMVEIVEAGIKACAKEILG